MSYISDLQSLMTPEQYSALIKPINSHYKGKIQDWQAQILTPLDVSKVNLPKQLTVTTKAPESYLVDIGEGSTEKRTKSYQPELDKTLRKDFEVLTDTVTGQEGEVTSSTVTGFKSKKPVTVNGLPVYAKYDASGKLTGYEGEGNKRAYVNNSTSLKGTWDVNGVAKPKPITASSGGFVKGLINDVASIPALNAAINVGAAIYGGPAGVAAWNAAQTKAAGGDWGDALTAGAKAGALAYAGQQLAQNYGGGADVGGGDITGTDMGSGGGNEGLMSGGSTGTSLKLPDALGQNTTNLETMGGAQGLTGGNTANLGLMGGAQGITAAGTTGALLGETGGALAAGGIGSGIGLSDAAIGAGTTAVGAGLGAGTLSDAALLKGGLTLAGGLLQSDTAKDAASTLATNQEKLANKVSEMGKFQPVGITTRFGTSSFTTDPVTGAITPSYTLSPEAQAYQDALAGMATTGLTAGKDIMSLGQQYIGESPEAVRNRYISTQQALLAPQQEQTLNNLRTRQQATGRGGLAMGATSGGMMATNPEMAAYYNSLAQSQNQLAANAETQYQNQVNFGTGLMNQATTPFTNVFNAQKGVETAGQQPLQMSTDFANTVATRGAAQGANYASLMNPSLQNQYKATADNPWATFLQGMSDSDLATWGLSKIKP